MHPPPRILVAFVAAGWVAAGAAQPRGALPAAICCERLSAEIRLDTRVVQPLQPLRDDGSAGLYGYPVDRDWGGPKPATVRAAMNMRLRQLIPAAAPQGQIIVDPNHPQWLSRAGGGPLFIVGPGDPEGFLYRGTRNLDGTRAGDQNALIDKLIQYGGNSIYMQMVRSHGGDGRGDHNPFVDSDPTKGIDTDILNQWEGWFTRMDDNGIVIFLFFYDDGAKVWDTGDQVGAEEQRYVTTLVNRFEHHRNLIWVIGEESEEAYSSARVRTLADLIRGADDHDHVIANHHRNGTTFKAWQSGAALEQFAMQINVSTAADLHAGCVDAWQKANGHFNLNMSEAGSHGTGATMRLKNWASAMGGAYVMVLGMTIDNTSTDDLAWCRIQQRFFEATNFNTMAPHDELAHAGTRWVLADPGQSYIAYADNLSSEIGLQGMTAGTYHFHWVDCVTGATVVQRDQAVAGGDQSWPTPAGIGTELAVWITRTGAADNIAPTANGQAVWVEQSDNLGIRLTYADPDGPGPHSFSIVNGPAHGKLTGSAEARTYTPDPGFSGTDSFAFSVHDGLAESLPVTVTITVDKADNQAPLADDKSVASTGG